LRRISASLFLLVLILSAWPCFGQDAEKGEHSFFLEGIGTILLVFDKSEAGYLDSSRLLLQKPGGLRRVIDTYEGLQPAELRKFDLDSDNSVEIIALLRHPDGFDVLPYVYRTDADFTRVLPADDEQESVQLIFREVVLSNIANTPVLCGKSRLSFHDFGPPDLYRIEFYQLKNDGLVLLEKGFSDGTHFNILMNKGAFAFNHGRYLDALDLYNESIASSTGEISTAAFIEALFFMAEARKFTKDFNGALELYEKIVLEFNQNQRTEQAQKSIELISANLVNINELSYFVDIVALFNANKCKEALELVENRVPGGKLEDRFRYMKAEILTAQNRLEEAVQVYLQIKKDFPESPVIDEIDVLLQDIQEIPEEAGGL
jgi:tetratricopeptide (TPR) repeat protein